jgi:hypothetical protein
MFRRIMVVKKKKKNNGKLSIFEKNQVWYNKITACLLAISLFLSVLVAIGILPITSKPHTIAYETITRDGNEEIYQILVYNFGKIGHNLRIEIEFPSNTTFSKIEETGSRLTKLNENIDPSYHYYNVVYSSIQEGESIGIRMIITNSDLKNDDSVLITPSFLGLWTDEEGQIKII